ncbi:hypothetical protein BZA05DRAFT_406091 [Tricharina praecox]|uniref:uncharacterized protein n=1 Tax=Tricharina praecox TaxID=43433 RepID=UPI00221FC293|nr:uncharacterized protein BZA05DRAFT_406091 [Tricharina praecox]KAI5846996.1 hypothetical protein BZA05DRAFT_406091 [Tricharina praecox]
MLDWTGKLLDWTGKLLDWTATATAIKAGGPAPPPWLNGTEQIQSTAYSPSISRPKIKTKDHRPSIPASTNIHTPTNTITMSSPLDQHDLHGHHHHTATTTTTTQFTDPFATTTDTHTARRASDGSVGDGMTPVPLAKRDRRLSKEWDAALTPPSRFQHVEGSIFATPASRDGHVQRNKIHGFKEKVLELSGGSRKKSTS